MDEYLFKQRTKRLALRIIEIVESLPKNRTADVLGRQLLRSGTSMGANYRAACRGKSTADVIAKLRIVEEEADESIYWMELLIESGLVSEARLSELLQETNEILAMTVASIRTLQKSGASSPINRQSKIENLNRRGMKQIARLLAILSILTAGGEMAQAQQPAKVPRVGIVSGGGEPSNPGSNVNVFRQGLRELGWVEGKNIVIEVRDAEGNIERIPSLATELVDLKVDVLVSSQLRGIQAAKQATKTIPIVMVTTADPVAAGLIDSLARPGGNITGLTLLTRELNGKRLELLKEMVPTISRVGVLHPDSVPVRIRFKEYAAAASALKIPIQSLEVQSENPDFEGAFRAAVRGRVSALIMLRNSVLILNRKQIADLAMKNRLSSMSERSDMVEAGALASYSTNEDESFRRAAVYVDKILKGAKPGDLPVERPTKFELVINLKTAKQIGLAIPPNVLARADRVIK